VRRTDTAGVGAGVRIEYRRAKPFEQASNAQTLAILYEFTWATSVPDGDTGRRSRLRNRYALVWNCWVARTTRSGSADLERESKRALRHDQHMSSSPTRWRTAHRFPHAGAGQRNHRRVPPRSREENVQRTPSASSSCSSSGSMSETDSRVCVIWSGRVHTSRRSRGRRSKVCEPSRTAATPKVLG
jgi:hypothetical protein